MLAGMTSEKPRRVYEPKDVAARLGMSVAGLRRLAHQYERVHGELPANERGRLWPEEAVEALEMARDAVRTGRAVSVESALRAAASPDGMDAPSTPVRPSQGDMVALTELLVELRALRESVDGMSKRLANLEDENRALRAALPTSTEPVVEDRESEEPESSPEPVAQSPKPGIFGRVRVWLREW